MFIWFEFEFALVVNTRVWFAGKYDGFLCKRWVFCVHIHSMYVFFMYLYLSILWYMECTCAYHDGHECQLTTKILRTYIMMKRWRKQNVMKLPAQQPNQQTCGEYLPKYLLDSYYN